MAISEQDRHRLYGRLEEILGADEAATLMEHLPPVGWADVATKRDLDALEARLTGRFDSKIGALEGKIGAVEGKIGAVEGKIGAQTRTLIFSVLGLQFSFVGLLGGMIALLR